ncbi:DUF4253 domain-containing protein [Streptomyces castrisilvae]|uniref:DUF4253 domain-containing protein n=1 Tax=Streptomyces castrisilvae TaxID=3033811 RepID=A0ABY9HTQ6_9ACTN|nr:DUF4253 domain-containing protein [Streptomyces sp. Mut1]WLQ37968.1 DUF4253 domain-containing protein [Streptomyces sp. Mut1]
MLSEQKARGPVPFLCWPDALGRPLGPDRVDAVRPEEVAATDFAEYRRRRLPLWMDPAPAPVPEGVEVQPHDPWPPFEQWPGLAPRIPAASADPKPEEAAASPLARLIQTGQFGLDECRLVLVPARRSSDALASIGWSAEAPLPLLCALLRSWEDRFGARVVAVFRSELQGLGTPAMRAARVVGSGVPLTAAQWARIEPLLPASTPAVDRDLAGEGC